MKKTGLFFSLFLSLSLAANAQFNNYSWQTLTTNGSLLPREENDFANVNGLFYLIGGRKVQDISVFDPKTSTWTNAAKPPIELHHFQAIVYDDEIYICGGMTGGYPHEKPVPNIYIYNPKTDTWRVGPEIPADRLRGCCGAVVYNNKFYLVCGITDGHWTGNVTWFDEYDPKTGQWKKLPDAPVSRDHFKAAVIGNRLYCIGGVQSDGKENKPLDKTVAEVDVFDFKTGAWSIADAQLPTLRSGCSAVVAGNEILIIGGESMAQTVAYNEVEAYNVKTGRFRKLPPLLAGRHATQGIYFNKKIYIAAGTGNRGGAPLLNSIECFASK